MESVSRSFRPSNYLLSSPSTTPHFLPLKLYPSKPLVSLRSSPKPFLSIRCSNKPPHDTPKSLTLNPLSSFLTATATATAAALLLAQFRFPPRSIASVASPVTTTSTESSESEQALTTDAEKERSLEEHLVSHPDDRHALRSLMDLRVKAGKFRDAISALDRLIELDPGENDLPLLKGHLLSYCGDAEAAKQEFERILAEDPLLVEAYHGLVMAQREVDGELDGILKRIESALESCKKLKRKDDVRDFRLLIAQLKVIEDNYEEALKIYQELVREEPRDFRPYLCQGIIYTLLKKKDEAEKQFEKYRRLVPRDHPYSRYFDDNMIAMKILSQVEENKRKESLKI